ncbi:MAG: hypothetical protein DMD67_14965 [Gemmatimonadetes bacterium]|nr:MAG: hypothetical protein DMD67_14965 [Gemmatimonadota bacterium]
MPKGTSKSTAIIQRLLEERRQYEAWLARLNDSADATPGHVRARVRSDYEARLSAVTEELRAHAESARQAIEEKRHLRGELQKKETRAGEKLTEAELRHSVGEYDEGQWTQVHADILAELVSVREDLQSVEADLQKLEELDALVRNKPIPPPPTRAPAAAPPAPPARPRAQPQPPLQPEATPHEDELAFIKSVTEDDKTAPSPARRIPSPRRSCPSRPKTRIKIRTPTRRCAAASVAR